MGRIAKIALNAPCNRCGKQPRAKTKDGRQYTMCTTCLSIKRQEWNDTYAEKHGLPLPSARKATTELLCQECGKHPRHQLGGVNHVRMTRCYDCYLKHKRDLHAARIERAQQLVPVDDMERTAEPKATRRVHIVDEPIAEQEQPAELFGLLAWSLQLIDQSRGAVANGEIDGLHINVTVQGVSMTLGTKKASE